MGFTRVVKLSLSKRRRKPNQRTPNLIKIALDAMGGDFAPEMPVSGACLAVKVRSDIFIYLVGQSDEINRQLCQLSMSDHPRLSVIHADEVIQMAESPSLAYRKKKQSSIHIGLNLVKNGEALGFFSAGNTGAVMTASTFILGRIPNVERPCIGGVMPGPVLLLDMGSNVDCKPNHLVQFALMGHYFAQDVMDIQNPRVGLLNIGEEDDKGNQLTQTVFPLLKEQPINFIGNIEAKQLLNRAADVVVCDGFVGNSVLKFGQGIVKVFFDFFKSEWKRSWRSKLALILLGPALKGFKKQYSYEEIGGAPLLGVNGVVFIGHGSSSDYAIQNGLLSVAHAIETKMVDEIASAVSAS